jgi:glycerol-3-phosphate dehydrogenase (NAD(P)+)
MINIRMSHMIKFDKIAVLGGGTFGIALAKLFALTSEQVLLWVRDEKVCQFINTHRHHPHRLMQIRIPNNVLALSDLAICVTNIPIVVFALPIPALTSVLTKASNFLHEDVIIVSTAKGVEQDSLALPYQVIKKTLTFWQYKRSCYLSGPSFAIELANDLPTALTLASLDDESANLLQQRFSKKNFRLYRSSDIIGVCLGGALKNVIAIAAGACSGLKLGKNAIASLITRGLAEITRLAIAMGGKPETLRGLSGMGDLILSCTDDMSRNHRFGTLLAQGFDLNSALLTIGSVVEGVNTTKTVPHLINRFNIDMPISLAVYQVLYHGLSSQDAISSLLSRSLKDEAY